ncbi:MAG: methyltransferase [Deltaproteobacteria bacterium]|nr:methyltransferase [Deltaproteobacteria bacterium]
MNERHAFAAEYRCIAADPPWPERGGGRIKRGADRHYKLLRPHEIISTILGAGVWRPALNCHLWLWATNNHLPDALFVMAALGFRYVTNAVWAKDRAGLGQYLRGRHELLLFGVRGRLPSQSRRCSTLIEAKRGRHSQKPLAAFQLIEAVSPGPRLEMFARSLRDGWDCWGDELVDDRATASGAV